MVHRISEGILTEAAVGRQRLPLEPWMPLSGARNPSTVWQGTVYVPHPGLGPWQLSLRLMQSNVWGNYVWVNGQQLAPAFPSEDFSGSWVSYTWEVPAGRLQPGPNQVAVSIGRSIPLLQNAGSAWDDLQIKDVVLWR
jgi:hypothetical protein